MPTPNRTRDSAGVMPTWLLVVLLILAILLAIAVPAFMGSNNKHGNPGSKNHGAPVIQTGGDHNGYAIP